MISLIFIKLLLIFVSSTISQPTLQSNSNITTRDVELLDPSQIAQKINNSLIYSFDALGLADNVFLKIFINYKTKTIELQQLLIYIHPYFDLYFSIRLERNGSSIFEYKFFGSSQNAQKLINVVEKFQYNDIIHIYHAEPYRLISVFEGLNNKEENNTFLLSDTGLKTIK
ncbi:uncharacterized protein LOC127276902 [Leptopilina boulardi]|uniref:uncharacterized protein LOC127276902 n=1 Tax=Leptopilina boulardi TaxID=63433 RepID=UPI0021F68BA4|nr:uncharacterized protein LOC127276902 [Leptopilina boulardi]